MPPVITAPLPHEDGDRATSPTEWIPARLRPIALAGLLAGVLSLAWAVWVARDAGDLAAQYAWTAFVRQHPGSAYNFSWYGGIHPASYSVISPYLMAWLGVRTTGVLACTAGACFGALLLIRCGLRRPLMPALWLAVAIWANLAAGRVTYLLGTVFVLMAAIALVPGTGSRRPRPAVAAILATVATLCSPVAGLFIEVLAAALFLTGRRRHAYWLAPGPPLVIAATALLFPFSGVQPFPWYAALLTVAGSVAVAVLVPAQWRLVRSAAWVYAAGVALCWALPTPIGSNVERLIMLAGAAVLICAGVAGHQQGRKLAITSLAATAIAIGTLAQPVRDIVRTEPTADAQPLITELLRRNAQEGRVEVVPMRTHTEASSIAPHVSLARGWNRQADVQRNPLFYDGTLTAAAYRAWLRTVGVGYVVLPTAEPDSAGLAEAEIITTGPAWLSLVWQNADWQLYRVADSDSLVSAPATVSYAGPDALTVHVPHGGSSLIRIAWSPWLVVNGHGACLARSGEWTELITPGAGTFTIEARYALNRGTPCA
ncbi:MFS transporter [Actinoplanes sp. TFC3]|uniref:MFS transporter n=1 Tax=Actinoplanes sp. TFC3 TaxID=1710355 RepID=UPI000B1A5802|nr:MFS transporter [Actinoplanes sp. TFC3]